MRADLALDIEDPDGVMAAVRPDLTDSQRIAFDVAVDGDELHIGVEADSLGVLRGGINTALMLTKLSEKTMR